MTGKEPCLLQNKNMLAHKKQIISYCIVAVLGLYLVTLQTTASNDISQLTKDAIKGDTSAQMQLGDMHYEGAGVLQDYAKAHAWYRIMALFGDNSSADKINQLQQAMTDDEMFDALKEYNIIYENISESVKAKQEPFRNGKIINCETANSRFKSLQRKDTNNFQGNNSLVDFCQLAEASLTIWTEIENIVAQCPQIDESGSESQFAKESIYWATETKLRTCN